MMARGFTVPCSQQPITSPYPEPDETCPHPLTTRLRGRLCYNWITGQNRSITRHTASKRVKLCNDVIPAEVLSMWMKLNTQWWPIDYPAA